MMQLDPGSLQLADRKINQAHTSSETTKQVMQKIEITLVSLIM